MEKPTKRITKITKRDVFMLIMGCVVTIFFVCSYNSIDTYNDLHLYASPGIGKYIIGQATWEAQTKAIIIANQCDFIMLDPIDSYLECVYSDCLKGDYCATGILKLETGNENNYQKCNCNI